MTSLPTLFLNNLLPIFIVAGVGYLIADWLHIQPGNLSKIVFYVFGPCLVFSLISNSRLEGEEVLRVLAFATIGAVLIALAGFLLGRALRLERSLLAAVILTSTFMNAGNFGMPVVSYAFGEAALAYAGLFFVCNNILTNTAGVVIASLGTTTLRKALGNLLTIPTLYALILGFIVQQNGWRLPLPISRPIELMGNASFATMLLLLGLQLRSVKWSKKLKPLALASVLRLAAGPALAIGLSAILGLSGVARQAGILESGMPTAVLTTVLATEFKIEPEFVTSVVVVTTLISAFTLTPLLAYLGG